MASRSFGCRATRTRSAAPSTGRPSSRPSPRRQSARRASSPSAAPAAKRRRSHRRCAAAQVRPALPAARAAAERSDALPCERRVRLRRPPGLRRDRGAARLQSGARVARHLRDASTTHDPARCCTSSRAACRGRSTRALGRRTRVRGARQSCPTTRRAARRSRCSAPPLRRARRSRSATLRRQAPLAALSSHALPSPLAHSPLPSRFPDRPLRRGGVANPSKDAAHGRRDAARLARRNLPRPTPQRVRHGRGRPAVSFPHVESRTRCVSDINAFNCGARAHNRALHQELLYSLCATASSSLE